MKLARTFLQQAVRRSAVCPRHFAAISGLNRSAAAEATGGSCRAQKAHFSDHSNSNNNDGSHSDFAPKHKVVESNDETEVLKMIEGHVKSNPIMLYIKGTPSAPQCGFSKTVVTILQNQNVDFSSVNVLAYASVRNGVKKYSDWPTIPQLFVKGEFVGGCDIVKSMNESGELGELLAEFKKESA
jgi:monothiol glutaredoxin